MNFAQMWRTTTGAERLFGLVLPLAALAGSGVLALASASVGAVLWWAASVPMLALLVRDVRAWRLEARRHVRPRPILPLDPTRGAIVDVVCLPAQRPHRWRWVPGHGWREIDHPDGKCGHDGEPASTSPPHLKGPHR